MQAGSPASLRRRHCIGRDHNDNSNDNSNDSDCNNDDNSDCDDNQGFLGRNDGRFLCSICLKVVSNKPVVTHCGHLYSWPCYYTWLEPSINNRECIAMFGGSGGGGACSCNSHSNHDDSDYDEGNSGSGLGSGGG